MKGNTLSAASAHEPVRILGCKPSFRIDAYDRAVDHYVTWLGFNLDWEWRAGPDQPVIISVTRDGLSLFLNEASEPTAVTLRVQVSNLQALAGEWNDKRPGAVEVFLEAPYDIPTAYVRDPFGNVMALQQPQSAQEAAIKVAECERVRNYLRARRVAGASRPGADATAAATNVTPGVASEVLSEFSDW